MKKVISLLLLAAMVLTMCACGKTGDPAASGESGAAGATRPARKELEWDVDQDPVLQEHQQHNAELLIPRHVERQAEEMDIYISNVQALAGFVPSSHVSSAFQNSMQSVFSSASTMISDKKGIHCHYLDYLDPETGKASANLQWQSCEASSTFKLKAQSRAFYENNVLPVEGAVSQLFESGDSPFRENALTLIASNLAEPGFEMDGIYNGVETYFDAYDHSAAAVIAFSSDFKGSMFVPNSESGDFGATFYIENYDRPLPMYFVVVGPEEAVKSYTDTLTGYMEEQNVECSSAVFTNSEYEKIMAPVLEFTPVEDTKPKKVEEPVFLSFNTGDMSWNDPGSIIRTSCSYASTRGVRSSDLTKGDTAGCTQVALFSDNYDDVSQYSVDYTLYVYDEASDSWVDAGKNADTMVVLESMLMDGPVSDEIYGEDIVSLTEGNRELYIRARLNFNQGSPLVRTNIYRLELQISLTRDNPDAGTTEQYTNLDDYCINGSAYYSSIEKMGTLAYPNRVWTAMMGTKDRAVAENAMGKTPNLAVLLAGLQDLESKYRTDEVTVQYVDILLTPGGDGRS